MTMNRPKRGQFGDNIVNICRDCVANAHNEWNFQFATNVSSGNNYWRWKRWDCIQEIHANSYSVNSKCIAKQNRCVSFCSVSFFSLVNCLKTNIQVTQIILMILHNRRQSTWVTKARLVQKINSYMNASCKLL